MHSSLQSMAMVDNGYIEQYQNKNKYYIQYQRVICSSLPIGLPLFS